MRLTRLSTTKTNLLLISNYWKNSWIFLVISYNYQFHNSTLLTINYYYYYYYYYYYFFRVFGGGFQWSLTNNKCSLVFRTLIILLDLNSDLVWIVSIHISIFITFPLLSKPLGTISARKLQKTHTTTLISHSFFSSLVKSKDCSLS